MRRSGVLALWPDRDPQIRKVIDIGDWDMDASANISIAHGLTLSKIRGALAAVRDDADTMLFSLAVINSSTTGLMSAGFNTAGIDATNVNLSRFTGGFFDATTYNATLYNRGFLLILHTP